MKGEEEEIRGAMEEVRFACGVCERLEQDLIRIQVDGESISRLIQVRLPEGYQVVSPEPSRVYESLVQLLMDLSSRLRELFHENTLRKLSESVV